jgi:hypothetical protein
MIAEGIAGQSGVVLIAGLADIMSFDAAITETYSSSAQVTSDPIEDGSSIADHVIYTPARVTIEGLHTNNPAIIGASLRVSPTRAEELDEKLLEAYENSSTLSIFASLRWLDDYVITEYNPTRDANSATALRFSLTLQHVTTVSSQVVGDVPIPSIPKGYPMFLTGLKSARYADAAILGAVGAGLLAWGMATS